MEVHMYLFSLTDFKSIAGLQFSHALLYELRLGKPKICDTYSVCFMLVTHVCLIKYSGKPTE